MRWGIEFAVSWSFQFFGTRKYNRKTLTAATLWTKKVNIIIQISFMYINLCMLPSLLTWLFVIISPQARPSTLLKAQVEEIKHKVAYQLLEYNIRQNKNVTFTSLLMTTSKHKIVMLNRRMRLSSRTADSNYNAWARVALCFLGHLRRFKVMYSSL